MLDCDWRPKRWITAAGRFHTVCNVVMQSHDTLYRPPWYVLRISDKTVWEKPWYYWHFYLGPPEVFLTRKAAEAKAKQLREQYAPSRVEVVKVMPVEALKENADGS